MFNMFFGVARITVGDREGKWPSSQKYHVGVSLFNSLNLQLNREVYWQRTCIIHLLLAECPLRTAYATRTEKNI